MKFLVSIHLFLFSLMAFSSQDYSFFEDKQEGFHLNMYGSFFLRSGVEFFKSKKVYPHFVGAGADFHKTFKYQGSGLAKALGFSEIQLKTDLGFIYSVQEKYFYFKLLEAYLQLGTDDFSFSFGRKKVVWSLDDFFWKRGLWQSRFQWDSLVPEFHGQLGAFFDTKIFDKKLALSLFYSPVFIPELVSDPLSLLDNDEKDMGQLSNPWAEGVLKEIRLDSDKKTYIRYQLDEIDILNVLLKPSLGGRLQYKNDNFRLRSSYAYKPMNQVSVASRVSVDSTTKQAPIVVKVTPYFFHHHIFATDLEIKLKEDLKLWISANYDYPINEYPGEVTNPELPWYVSSDEWAFQETDPSFYLSAYVSYQLNQLNLYAGGSYVSYCKKGKTLLCKDGDWVINETGSRLVSKLTELSWNSRHRFLSSFKLGGEYALNKGPLFKKLKLGSSVLYDFFQKGIVLEAYLKMNVSAVLECAIYLDMIGFVSHTKAPVDGFISEFRANDRIYGVLKYVF